MSQDKELITKVCEASKEIDGKKKINCIQAFALAKENEVSVRRIGDICNEQDIRICNCQLGCFE